jgi:hypothetical protein
MSASIEIWMLTYAVSTRLSQTINSQDLLYIKGSLEKKRKKDGGEEILTTTRERAQNHLKIPRQRLIQEKLQLNASNIGWRTSPFMVST